ncbi:hypothetical protein DWZ99_19345 [Odoribacter splanchnicus]|uniref:hypothetical protein n=2 Tax=Odoribacter splanchnicus TaxID=28118 RepID=UPI000E4C0F30|nr:hypothetical protein DWZ99_19345 [Odoribacter splanchnicus]
MRRTGVLIWILWMGLFGFTSCTDRLEEVEEQYTGENEVWVRLIVSRPYSGKEVRSKAGNDRETEIDEIQLLVFEEGGYKYRVPGISITNSGTTTSFSARLLATDKTLDLYIVANATAAVLANEPQVGDTENEVRTKLQLGFPLGGNFTTLPMSGHYRLVSGLDANYRQEISGVSMLRAVARVDVLVGGITNFELTSIQAYRVNSRIQLIANQDLPVVTAPSIPVNSRMEVNTPVSAVSGNQAVSGLYLSESVSPAESERVNGATCVVVGGKYAGSGEVTYYRIDFDPDDTQGSFGQILRNHRYVFTIRSVAGPGWPSADEAASNRSAQINLDIQSWDESTTDMYFDTDHHFGVSTREVVLGSKQNAALTVQVDTDLSDYTFQWSDEQGNVSGTAAQSLTGSYFKVEKTNNGRHIVVTALQSNNSDSDERKAYFVINASRWRILMTIRQQIVDISGRTINMVSFRSYLGHLGENLLLPNISPESRGAGLQGILNNPANFGTGGTVTCGGFNLLLTNVSASSINDAALALADVIYFNYVSNGDLRIDLSPVGRWLKASAKRVLILSFDSQGVNTPIMQEFLGSTPDLMQTSPKSGSYPLAGKSVSDFFTDMGPFTVTPYTPVDANFKFQNYDVTHGEIGPGSAEGITPPLNGPGGGIVLGVDMSRRIIYIGDIDIFSANNSNSGINNSKGTINSNASKLIANLFAWVVGVVQ